MTVFLKCMNCLKRYFTDSTLLPNKVQQGENKVLQREKHWSLFISTVVPQMDFKSSNLDIIMSQVLFIFKASCPSCPH